MRGIVFKARGKFYSSLKQAREDNPRLTRWSVMYFDLLNNKRNLCALLNGKGEDLALNKREIK